jgi:hypothetical protein
MVQKLMSVLAVTLLSGLLMSADSSHGNSLKRSDLPRAVLNTLDANYKNAEIRGILKITDDEDSVPAFVVGMTFEGQQVIAAIDLVGKLLEEALFLSLDKVPELVQTSFLQSPQGQLEVRGAARVTKIGSPPVYDIVVLDEKVPLHIIYAMDGTRLGAAYELPEGVDERSARAEDEDRWVD